jgi:hypothetical protein
MLLRVDDFVDDRDVEVSYIADYKPQALLGRVERYLWSVPLKPATLS